MKEITIIMGYNAAGKSTLVEEYVQKGYYRINRDTTGGSLDGQVNHVRAALHAGNTKIVLDNTYRNSEARAEIIAFAVNEGIPINCVHLDTSFEDAQLNACFRQVKRLGRLLMPEDYKTMKDPNLFPPAALFSYRKQFEPPTTGEGFAKVETVPFVRKPLPDEYDGWALILDYDDNLRTSTGAEKFPCTKDDVQLLPGRKLRINAYMKEMEKQHGKPGKLLGWSNQSGVGKGTLTLEACKECFDFTNTLLGLNIEYYFCPHRSPPAVFCYCRKPAPGNGVVMIEKHKLDPKKCLYVGDQTSDKTAATRLGMQFLHTDEFFK